MNKKHSRTNALKGLTKKSPMETGNETRTDSTTRFDPVTLRVDTTPVGSRKVAEGGFGWGNAIKSGNKNASMWKNKRDNVATKKVEANNKAKSNASKKGSGGMTPIMPNE